MKKIGILTFPNSPSFGASLQMSGLYFALENMGYEPFVINYMNDHMKRKKHINSGKKNKVKEFIKSLTEISSIRKFKEFERSLKFLPKRMISDRKYLEIMAEKLDKVVCGSDQVWNPHIIGNDWSYFLDFCPSHKRISYAPSFGLTQLPEELKKTIGNELKKFSALSVREHQAKEIVNEFVFEDIPVVLDPTMLHSKEFWKSCQARPSIKDKKYIASFLFHPNSDTSEFVNKLEKDTNVKLLKYTWSLKQAMKDRNCVTGFGPAQWLWYIDHADYVVTDSFHGCVFSILFQKEFFVSMTATTNSRLINLLETFDLMDRVVDVNKDLLQYKLIDYKAVEEKIHKMQEYSLTFLRDALKK